MERVSGLPPVIGESPELLILGSFPGRISLIRGEYYAASGNRFWPLIEALFGISCDLPYDIRCSLIMENHIALWDVIASCEREGSSDSRIENPVINDIEGLLERHPSITHIALNGRAGAEKWLKRGLPEIMKREEISLRAYPSTSPANARFRFEDLRNAWESIVIHKN